MYGNNVFILVFLLCFGIIAGVLFIYADSCLRTVSREAYISFDPASADTPETDETSGRINPPLKWKFFMLSGVSAAIITLFFFMIVRNLVKPLEKLSRTARTIVSGDMAVRIPVSGDGFAAHVGSSVRQMTEYFRKRLQDVSHQRDQQDAILSSMIEGVLALDTSSSIIRINKAALNLLKATENAVGKALHEVVRNTGLQNFAESILREKKPLEDEFVFYNPNEYFLRVRGTVLKDIDNKVIGALIMLNDVTEMRRLENMRRDFVANVSHEIKTPLTAIKASVETIQDGFASGEDMKRFMKIIAKNSDRLNALVEDILSLSKIEREVEKGEHDFSSAMLSDVIDTAINFCKERAEERNIKVDVECNPGLSAKLDRQLFEQALINLIDNAIKYSGDGSRVLVKAERSEQALELHVSDNGCGISREHIPRLFERFYRVDKARSRKLGGTGLGLAIVKHIAQTHKGTVKVESTPGKGSTFTIIIPA